MKNERKERKKIRNGTIQKQYRNNTDTRKAQIKQTTNTKRNETQTLKARKDKHGKQGKTGIQGKNTCIQDRNTDTQYRNTDTQYRNTRQKKSTYTI